MNVNIDMKKLRIICLIIFGVALAASLIFWFTQIRKGDRVGPVITMDKDELNVDLDKRFLLLGIKIKKYKGIL